MTGEVPHHVRYIGSRYIIRLGISDLDIHRLLRYIGSRYIGCRYIGC